MSKPFRVGIRAKLVILTTALLTIVFGLIGFYLARSNTNTLRSNLYDEARSFATLATEPIGSVFTLYKDSGTINIDREMNDFSKLNKNITNIEIIDIYGQIQYSLNIDQSINVTSAQAESFEPVYIYNSNDVVETIIYPYKENNGIRRYSVLYRVSSDSINIAVRDASKSVLILSIAGLTSTTLLLYYFINRWLVRRIRLISHQSSLISGGQLDQNIAIKSTDELGELSRSVNSMAESLKADIVKLRELDKAKTEFMMITSHNIRTPLSIINGFIDSSDNYNTVSELRDALSKIEAGSKRLSVFAEDVLTISRLEMGESISSLVRVDITEFLGALSMDFAPLAQLKQINFKDDIPHIGKDVLINRPYARAAIWNILDNALKFTAEGGSIILNAVDKESYVEISIEDNGIGIKPEEVSKLFTKFHRGTDTLTYDYEGTGIGLYATKMIFDRLHGEVKVKSTFGVGTRFTLTLPYTDKDVEPTFRPREDRL